jgi:ankyrin repeat protein
MDTGTTALMFASDSGHLAVAKELLEHGADPNTATTDNGRTALMRASLNCHLDVVKELLERGADRNVVKTDDGATALVCASAAGNLEVVALLQGAEGVSVSGVSGAAAARPPMEVVRSKDGSMVHSLDCYPYTFSPLLLFAPGGYFDKGHSNYNSVVRFFEPVLLPLGVDMLTNVLYDRRNECVLGSRTYVFARVFFGWKKQAAPIFRVNVILWKQVL